MNYFSVSDVVPSCSSTTCRFGECEQLEFDFRCHCGDVRTLKNLPN